MKFMMMRFTFMIFKTRIQSFHKMSSDKFENTIEMIAMILRIIKLQFEILKSFHAIGHGAEMG